MTAQLVTPALPLVVPGLVARRDGSMTPVATVEHRGYHLTGSGRSAAVAGGLLFTGTVAGSFEVPMTPVAMALSVAICLLVAFSGRWPVPAGIAIVGLCAVLAIGLPQQESLAIYGCLAPLIACGAVGLTVQRRWFTVAAVVLIFGQILTRLPVEAEADLLVPVLASHTVFVGVVVALSWAAGETVHLLMLHKREESRGTVRALRREIARDLHDGVAYTMSVIAIRAEQGRRNGGATEADLAFIADRSREAIEDLRNVLAILRRDEPDGSQFRMDWRSRPLAEVIAGETAALEEAGFPVAVTIEGRLDAVPRSIADAMGRVLHEASGNVQRHAAGGECVLLVEVSDQHVELALINQLAPTRNTSHEPLGILGMRERVEGLGGCLEAGPVGTHWILRATVPITARGALQ